MSRLLTEALQRQQSPGRPASPPDAETPMDEGAAWSEPRFNPLAGARDEPARRWPKLVLAAGYVGLIGLIGWQGSLLLPDLLSAPEPEPDQTVSAEADLPAADRSTGPDAGGGDSTVVSVELPEGLPATAQTVSPLAQPESEGAAAAEDEASAAEPEAPSAETQAPAEETTAPAIARVETAITADSETTEQPLSELPELNPPAQEQETATAEATAEPVTETSRVSFSSTDRQRVLQQATRYHDENNTAAALNLMRERLLEDDHTDVRQHYARLLLRSGDVETARHVVRPGHNRNELELRAYADYQAGAYTDARRHYEELLRRADNPRQEWYLWLAICNDHLQDDRQAIVYYETYLSQSRDQPDSLVQYARERLQQLSG